MRKRHKFLQMEQNMTSQNNSFKVKFKHKFLISFHQIAGRTVAEYYNHTFSCILSLLFRRHLWREELYTQMGFFVQPILGDRYIHRREM